MIGRHDFSGECAPVDGLADFETFSVGIFEWIPVVAMDGRKKKGKVKVRVIGSTKAPDAVYEKANEIVRLMNDGRYCGPKMVKA